MNQVEKEVGDVSMDDNATTSTTTAITTVATSDPTNDSSNMIVPMAVDAPVIVPANDAPTGDMVTDEDVDMLLGLEDSSSSQGTPPTPPPPQPKPTPRKPMLKAPQGRKRFISPLKVQALGFGDINLLQDTSTATTTPSSSSLPSLVSSPSSSPGPQRSPVLPNNAPASKGFQYPESLDTQKKKRRRIVPKKFLTPGTASREFKAPTSNSAQQTPSPQSSNTSVTSLVCFTLLTSLYSTQIHIPHAATLQLLCLTKSHLSKAHRPILHQKQITDF